MTATKKYLPDVCPICGTPRAVVDGAYLRRLRERAGLTLREMARRAGYTPAYLCDIEHNRRSRLPAIVAAYEQAAEETMRRRGTLNRGYSCASCEGEA